MFGERQISLRVTERARLWIENFKRRSGLKDPILLFQWSKVVGQPYEELMVGLFERKNVSEGWLGIAGELEFIVIQEWVLDKLDGKILDAIAAEGGTPRLSIAPGP